MRLKPLHNYLLIEKCQVVDLGKILVPEGETAAYTLVRILEIPENFPEYRVGQLLLVRSEGIEKVEVGGEVFNLVQTNYAVAYLLQ